MTMATVQCNDSAPAALAPESAKTPESLFSTHGTRRDTHRARSVRQHSPSSHHRGQQAEAICPPTSAITTLYVRNGDEFSEAEEDEILTQALSLISARFCLGAPVMANPEEVRKFLRLHLGPRDYEV